ncbi:Golgi transport complex subunit 3 [Coemansia sp. RSA 2706]|nr:Golgi transport complex subunit 3 [Coemansia sp. RSA 2706]KAJ2322378.1 Golgi transport complex subunit 3 [Coemansia sp. RSA 2704]KAJ2330160.1 Golgi transport complex subunit 3 [Coemansia sp. RSA 2702]KAJ2370262.1 Golgi transport complex subunit 3 [Coemansia sp. RSA 2610]KAJ2738523.1 Golgi transport complex subunit 3 [Coemansia sp. Cherry 401B]
MGQDEWDQRFALAEAQRAGLAQLQEACAAHSARLLTHAADRQAAARQVQQLRGSSKGSPQLSARRNLSLRNLARAASPAPLMGGGHAPHGPDRAVETTAQFLEWYGGVEARLAAEQDAESHAHAERLRAHTRACAEMRASVARAEARLDAVGAAYARVCAQTGGVRAACAELQTRRERLARADAEIGAQLCVYDELADIARLFSAPGDVCRDAGFLPALGRAERALEFLSRHADARDSELYAQRFAQCRTRALTLIKMHATHAFRRLGGDAARATQAAQVDVRFRAAAVGLRPLLRALCERRRSDDAAQVLGDVQHAYFQARRAWLRAHVPRALQAIAREHAGGGAADTLRDWCAFMMGACADEGRLHAEFFGGDGGDELRAHEDLAMELFHEQVRPQIIREADVGALAALSLTLLTYQRPAPADGAPADLDAFYAAADAVLSDVQQRLAFRAQEYVRTQIAGFRMGAADLDHAARWVRDGAPWEYPPVARTRWLAAQLSGCVDPEVLRGLAGEALAACKQSVVGQARALRDATADGEQLAHAFVTGALPQAEQAVADLLI